MNPLNDADMRAIVQKAILDNMTPELREKLLVDALRSLMNVGQNQYDKRTLLEKAFAEAAYMVAREALETEMREGGKLREQVQTVVGKVLERALSDDEDLIGELTKAVVHAFRVRDY